MNIFLHILLIAVLIAALLFLLSLIIYYFNLDMKAAALIEPVLRRHYDKMKRDRKF